MYFDGYALIGSKVVYIKWFEWKYVEIYISTIPDKN